MCWYCSWQETIWAKDVGWKVPQAHENAAWGTYVSTHVHTSSWCCITAWQKTTEMAMHREAVAGYDDSPSLFSTCCLFGNLSHPSHSAPVIQLWCQTRLRWPTKASSPGPAAWKCSPLQAHPHSPRQRVCHDPGVPVLLVPQGWAPRHPPPASAPGPALAAAWGSRGPSAGSTRWRSEGAAHGGAGLLLGAGETRPARYRGRCSGDQGGCGWRRWCDRQERGWEAPEGTAPARRHRSAGLLPRPRARTIPFFCRTKVEPFTRLETTATLKPRDTAAGPGLCAAPSPAAAPTAIRIAPPRATGTAAAPGPAHPAAALRRDPPCAAPRRAVRPAPPEAAPGGHRRQPRLLAPVPRGAGIRMTS